MCRVDGADPPDFVRSDERRANKQHQCDECRRTIEPGERYQASAMGYEGRCYAFRCCGHCRVAQVWLVENCGGFLHHDVLDDIREHAEEYRSQPLHDIVTGMRRQWKALDGAGLMPLPAMPPIFDKERP